MSIMRGEFTQVLQAFREGYRIVGLVRERDDLNSQRTLRKLWIMQRALERREFVVPEDWVCPDGSH